MPAKFWMVFVEGKNSPVKRHKTELSAREEARRLVLLGNQAAYVLEAVACCTRAADVHWAELEGGEYAQTQAN